MSGLSFSQWLVICPLVASACLQRVAAKLSADAIASAMDVDTVFRENGVDAHIGEMQNNSVL